MEYTLAIDIGASSGRHVAAWVQAGHLHTREVYRFENTLVQRGGQLCWDIDALLHHVVAGMRACAQQGMQPKSAGIDTWGVDFALLDEAGNRLGEVVAYRDGRTKGLDKIVEQALPFAEHYRRTGIQKQPFNTVYQLAALAQSQPALLQKARHLLMVPDYLHYRLTGKMAQEYTNATTTALVNAEAAEWDGQIIKALGLPGGLFGPLAEPGTRLGTLLPEIQQQVGFDCEILLPATHDTGSAYLAVPARDENAAYLSSGTWSLLGLESPTPVATPAAMAANLTNEGGYQRRYRLLKNIMGLWMIQSIRREGGKAHSFAQLEQMARGSGYTGRVDVNHESFLAPESMVAAVQRRCAETGQPPCTTLPDVMACVYHSLAGCYRGAVEELAAVTGRRFTSVNIVGGGSKDGTLNQLTANATGLPVLAGPTEGTVLGNLLVQMLAAGEFESLQAARDAVRESFDIQTYIPQEG